MHCSSSSFLWLKHADFSLGLNSYHLSLGCRSRCCWKLKRNCRSTLRRPEARPASPWRQVSVSWPTASPDRRGWVVLITLLSSGASLFWGSGPEQPPSHRDNPSSPPKLPTPSSSSSSSPTSSHDPCERRAVGGAENGDITSQEAPSSPLVQHRWVNCFAFIWSL